MTAAPVLVVDDDPKIVTLVRTYLEREGFPVVTAGDGRAALAAVAEAQPRLIVLDLMLPELDGLALMRIVRERSEVPIVILSARGSAADPRAERITIGTSERSRTIRIKASPSSSGSIRSSTISLGCASATAARAARPSPAVTTGKPSRSRYVRTSVTIFGSSSTTSTGAAVMPASS